MKEKQADKPALRDVTPAIAGEYAVNLGRIGLSPNSFNKHIRFLELIYRATRDRARWDRNPWEDIKRKRQVTSSRRELTVDELRTVCNVADGELRLLFALGIYTGLRLGDCATLRWGGEGTPEEQAVADAATVPAAKVRELAAMLKPENASETKKALLALLDGQ
jgi:hypothetical protein